MHLDEGAHARELRVAADPDDDAVTAVCCDADTLDTRLALGGVLVAKAKACGGAHEPLACPAALDDGRRPGANTQSTHASRHGLPRPEAPDAVGTREPPPAPGMQPMNGRKVGARSE